jgi:hypothetical protein
MNTSFEYSQRHFFTSPEITTGRPRPGWSGGRFKWLFRTGRQAAHVPLADGISIWPRPRAWRWPHCLVVCGFAVVGLATGLRAEVLTQFFQGTIPLNGDISGFFERDGLTPKPGVYVVDNPYGLNEPPLSGSATKDGSGHPWGFKHRRTMLAFNPDLNSGTVFIGIDLPGGTGRNSDSKTIHAFPGDPNPNYADSLVGIAIPGGGRGKIVPFDGDGNGEADTIGRTAEGGPLFRCPGGPADTIDVLCCVCAGGAGISDNPRIASGATLGEEEFYTIRLTFGDGSRVEASWRIGGHTPAGQAELLVRSSDVPAPFEVRVSSNTGTTGVPLGFDVMFSVSGVNAAVTNAAARLVQVLEVWSGTTRTGPDYATMQCVYPCNPSPAVRRSAYARHIEVCWSACLSGCRLESTTDLLGGCWEEVAVAPVETNGECVVTLPVDASACRFFRLRLP